MPDHPPLTHQEPRHHPVDDHWSWSERADELTSDAEIGLPWARAAIEWISTLADGPIGTVLDVGAGPGVFTAALAEHFVDAEVFAVDESAHLLTRAAARAVEFGVAARVRTIAGSLDAELDHLPRADVIWASRVLHHVPDQAGTLIALRGWLNPGGVLAIVEGGLPTRYLPAECGVGAPGLFARIEAAVSNEIHARLHDDHAPGVERPALDWPMQLRAAGLTPSGSRSFLLDLPAPVSADVRRWLVSWTAKTRSWVGDVLSAEDNAALGRLLDTDDTLGLAQRPDLFLLSAVTVHTARHGR